MDEATARHDRQEGGLRERPDVPGDGRVARARRSVASSRRCMAGTDTTLHPGEEARTISATVPSWTPGPWWAWARAAPPRRRGRGRLTPIREKGGSPMVKVCAALVACVVLAGPSFAEAPLMCFGNEPSWKVDLTTPGVAKAAMMGEETKTYRGEPTRNERAEGDALARVTRRRPRPGGVPERQAVQRPDVGRRAPGHGARVVPGPALLRRAVAASSPPAREAAGRQRRHQPLEGKAWRLQSLPGQGRESPRRPCASR